jgi:natural product biosynthesis luciferase-like monooxygenase protein
VTLQPDGGYPLSYGQQALWFLHRLSPQSPAYNFVLAARVLGATKPEWLRSAMEGLVERHASLRTVYGRGHDGPVQRVMPPSRADVVDCECSGLTTGDIVERMTAEANRPFDLEQGPVFRGAILTRSDNQHYVLMTAHHIAIDFTSLGVLLQDFGELHRSGATGSAPSLRQTRYAYTDYVSRQAELVHGTGGERLWNFWRNQLAPPLPLLQIPTDHPRPRVQTFRGSTLPVVIGAEPTKRLKRLAQGCGAPLEAAVLAAFMTLLRDWTGQSDILVGRPAPGRWPDFADVVGYFVNPVVVRTKLADRGQFADLVQRVGVSLSDALRNQGFPFSLLVERLQPTRDPRYSPIFQVLFAFYDLDEEQALPLLGGPAHEHRVAVGDLQFEAVPLAHGGAMFDLSLVAVSHAGTLTAYLQYNVDLFEQSTIERVGERLRFLLETAGADPVRGSTPVHTGSISCSDRLELPPSGAPATSDGMAFSLFFFASDDQQEEGAPYRLLIDAARFADDHGFAAVWTPERHFHPFGGIFPNPAVTGAAIAAITKRIQIRAGSVVLPIHHPVRVAEEWAVVDNLSNGRVAVSFASGWHANDFVFAPDNYFERREVMAQEIETVRRLWRGDAASYRAGDGRQVDVRIWPRPVQPELPIWVTAFGSPDTFRLAGRIGAGVLTHLLGQSVLDLGAKIALYRGARQTSGLDPASGQIAVMLHTYVGDHVDAVREKVRRPFIQYLRTSVDLARVGEQAGLAMDGEHYRPSTVDAFLQATFDRYFATNTLFGTPETCAPLVERLGDVGVTEIACLIDFGVDIDSVLQGLGALDRLRARCSRSPAVVGPAHDEVQRAVTGATDRVQARKRALERTHARRTTHRGR